MNRRRFITATATTVAASALGADAQTPKKRPATSVTPAPKPAATPRALDRNAPWRGVNLGAWLVLEKWMTPSLFKGVTAGDEYGLSKELGPDKARALLEKHRAGWITEADFAAIAGRGLNAVRIPVGWWALGGADTAPYISAEATLDRALAWAERHGLGVVLDLHAAPGSQNGWDHSGRAGELGWHKSPAHIARSLDAIEALAARYGKRENLVGIELLNEPRWDVPMEILRSYYTDGYARVRKHASAERVAVVIHDGFRPFDWGGFMTGPEFKNVVLDTHMYQCYTDDDKKRSLAGHLQKASTQRIEEIAKMEKNSPRVCVGEWSVALNPDSLQNLTATQKTVGKRAYGAAQLLAFEGSKGGYFYWSYKLEYPTDWSYQTAVEEGALP